MNRRVTPDLLATLIDGYRSGQSPTNLSGITGLHRSTIRAALLAAGERLRHRPEAIRTAWARKTQRHRVPTSPDLIDRYLAGQSPTTLAASEGCSRSTILRRLRDADIPLRTLTEASRGRP